jgi:hypothetical protein
MAVADRVTWENSQRMHRVRQDPALRGKRSYVYWYEPPRESELRPLGVYTWDTRKVRFHEPHAAADRAAFETTWGKLGVHTVVYGVHEGQHVVWTKTTYTHVDADFVRHWAAVPSPGLAASRVLLVPSDHGYRSGYFLQFSTFSTGVDPEKTLWVRWYRQQWRVKFLRRTAESVHAAERANLVISRQVPVDAWKASAARHKLGALRDTLAAMQARLSSAALQTEMLAEWHRTLAAHKGRTKADGLEGVLCL